MGQLDAYIDTADEKKDSGLKHIQRENAYSSLHLQKLMGVLLQRHHTIVWMVTDLLAFEKFGVEGRIVARSFNAPAIAAKNTQRRFSLTKGNNRAVVQLLFDEGVEEHLFYGEEILWQVHSKPGETYLLKPLLNELGEPVKYLENNEYMLQRMFPKLGHEGPLLRITYYAPKTFL